MGKINSTNCGVCWIQDNRESPGTWAHIDGKDVDFYCDAHLRTMGIDVGECETVEAWRRMNGLSAPPPATQPVRMPAKPTAPSPEPEEQPSQPLAAPASQPVKREKRTPTEAPKPKSKEPARCAKCRNRLRHGWPDTLCRGCREEENKATEPKKRRGRPPKSAGTQVATHKVTTTKNTNGHGKQEVAGLQVSVMSLEEYREKYPLRNQARELDPIVSFVAAMDRKSVARFDTPKGARLKSFRDRVAKMLQVRHKLPVTIEQNTSHGCIAVIWKANA